METVGTSVPPACSASAREVLRLFGSAKSSFSLAGI